MATFFERMLALPAWAWFAAAFMSHTLGSETWYWMLLMPFVSLTRSIYHERMAVHAAAQGGPGHTETTSPASGVSSESSKPTQADKKQP